MDIALVQEFLPDNPMDAFQQGLEAIREAADAGAELVIFPELSFTEFYPQVPASERGGSVLDLADPVPGPLTQSIASTAAEYGVVVVFNLYERDGDEAYNTSPVIDADGTLLGATRMMHITQYEHFYEQDYYTPGNTGAPVYDTAVGRIGVAPCYDRHYPEYLRALALQEAEIVAVPQAGTTGEWPKGVFESELRAASFQNGFFMALANRVGREGNMVFDGSSLVTGPRGQVIAQAPSGEAIILLASVNTDRCDTSPARQLFLQHRRPDQYERGAVALAASVPVAKNGLEDIEATTADVEAAAEMEIDESQFRDARLDLGEAEATEGEATEGEATEGEKPGDDEAVEAQAEAVEGETEGDEATAEAEGAEAAEDGEPEDGEPEDGEPEDGEPEDGEPEDRESEDGEMEAADDAEDEPEKQESTAEDDKA
jgi:N-carbamoylputrescine amidase